MLQEVHSTCEVEKQWYAEWGYNIHFCHGQSDARGVCILFKNNFDYEIHNTISDNSGRYLILDVSIYQQRVTLVNIYGHNEDKPAFYEEVIEQIENLPNDHRIIGGDFNFVLDVYQDKQGGTLSLTLKIKKLSQHGLKNLTW